MEAFQLSDLSFSYPSSEEAALKNLSLSIEEGSFVVVCGPSGCGKSTLLRQLKTVLAPHGKKEGQILFFGEPLTLVPAEKQAAAIGFVQQDPDNQIVTDKVWHELAFGLESLGRDTQTIRARVAEMASFFGIQNWFYKNTSELSGGQKQLLNLASIMAMQPSVLILDEPASQLDPIAAADFLATVGKINRELGVTVILTEHRLEEVFPLADRVLVMDKGSIVADGSPADIGKNLLKQGSSMFCSMPAAMKLWAGCGGEGDCPVTVRDGRRWFQQASDGRMLQPLPEETERFDAAETVLSFEDAWFRYEQSLPDVVKGLTLSLKKGSFTALLGGNGTGKTTALGLAAGIRKPYRGNVSCKGRAVLLPQDPKSLFLKKTLREDLLEVFGRTAVPEADQKLRVMKMVSLCRLEGLLERHPYDLSGGEQQRAALAKVLLLEPDLLLLDEPTKGLDGEFKQVFASILKSLAAGGITILMVSHDIEFCAEHADRCALFFDGSVITQGTPRHFFGENSFYTTAANRIARDLLPDAVTADQVILALGGTPEKPSGKERSDVFVRTALPEEPAEPGGKLPLWKRLLALFSGAGALGILAKAASQTDLTSLLTGEGLTSLSTGQLRLIGAMIACLSLLAFAVSGPSKEKSPAYSPLEKRKISKRTALSAMLILLLIPLTLFFGVYYLGGRKYYFIALLILLEIMLPFFMVFEGRKPQARELVVISVLCAIGTAGRAFFFMLPSFKPVMAVVIITGVALGGETGFLTGALTMLISNILFSQGPWTPWQMFAMGITGFLAGVLYRKGLLGRSRLSLSVFGALCAIVVYGGIMNPASALMWTYRLNKEILLSYYISGFPVDCVHAAATFFFLWFGAEPMLEKLDRIKVKYGLME